MRSSYLACCLCASLSVACSDTRTIGDGGHTAMQDSGIDAGHSAQDSGLETPDSGFIALFADIQYATRCESTLGCAGAMDRDICGFDDGDPCEGFVSSAMVECSVVETASTRTISFEASQGGGFSLRVASLEVPLAGGSATGGTCQVTVVEGPNIYAGACGASAPSAAQPCQITNVTFEDDLGNPTFEGDLFCQFLPNRANPALQIEVTAFGSGPVAAAAPGRFRIANCPGHTL